MNKIRIALIVDNRLSRAILPKMRSHSNEIEIIGEATNGIEASQLIKYGSPDIAIVDLGLPNLDGVELIKKFKLRDSQGNSPTKIIVMTSEDDQNAVRKTFAVGADSFCIKDSNFDWLLEAIKATQTGDCWIDPAIAQMVLSEVRNFMPQDKVQPESDTKVEINALQSEYRQYVKISPLTGRELEVMNLIVDGYSNAEISQQLYITIGTVKTHVRNILNKLCVDDRTQAAVCALRTGLVS